MYAKYINKNIVHTIYLHIAWTACLTLLKQTTRKPGIWRIQSCVGCLSVSSVNEGTLGSSIQKGSYTFTVKSKIHFKIYWDAYHFFNDFWLSITDSFRRLQKMSPLFGWLGCHQWTECSPCRHHHLQNCPFCSSSIAWQYPKQWPVVGDGWGSYWLFS